MGNEAADDAWAMDPNVERRFECVECRTKIKHTGTLGDWNRLMEWHTVFACQQLQAQLKAQDSTTTGGGR